MIDTLFFRSLNCVLEKGQNVLELFLNFLKKLSGHPDKTEHPFADLLRGDWQSLRQRYMNKKIS